ncbi:hypothetical protein TB1_015119 [Malus domestica]
MLNSSEQERPIAGQVSHSGEQEAPNSEENLDSSEAVHVSEDSTDSGEATSAEMSSTEAPISGKVSDSEQELPKPSWESSTISLLGKILETHLKSKRQSLPKLTRTTPSLSSKWPLQEISAFHILLIF